MTTAPPSPPLAPLPNAPAPAPKRRSPVFTALLILSGGVLVYFLLFHAQPQQVPFGMFIELVKAGHVQTATVSASAISGRFDREASLPIFEAWLAKEKSFDAAQGGDAPPIEEEKPNRTHSPPFSGVSENSYPYVVVRGGFKDDELIEQLHAEYPGLHWSQETSGGFLFYLLVWISMLALLVFLWFVVMRRTDSIGQQVMSFGKSRARFMTLDNTNTTFDDVAGCDEAKEELEEIIGFLRDPERFQRLGGTAPRGVLLIGSPGTGKTLMARAVAGEAHVPFISLSGSDFVEMFVGVGAARVRDLFAQAKAKAPCIVFIDEIDAVGRQRGASLSNSNDEREQTLNQLLSEMDGFEPNAGVIVLAATNRPDVLDQALLRPGRFDRQVVIDSPDFRGREQILRVHARGKPLADDVELADTARRTPGFSGADLANVMNEAALLAARHQHDAIERADLEEAVERVMAGPERRSRVIRPHEKEVIAYHETGHALVSYFVERSDHVEKISIVPRGHGALGYTLSLPMEDRYISQRAELVDRICVLLGGRTAEEIIFGDSSTGAADDLEKVSDIARAIVCRFGMSDELGPLVFQRDEARSFLRQAQGDELTARYSDETLTKIDRAVRELVNGCAERTRKILTENRDLLTELATELIDREVMEGAEFARIIRERMGDRAPARARSQVGSGGTKARRARADQKLSAQHVAEVERSQSTGVDGVPGQTP